MKRREALLGILSLPILGKALPRMVEKPGAGYETFELTFTEEMFSTDSILQSPNYEGVIADRPLNFTFDLDGKEYTIIYDWEKFRNDQVKLDKLGTLYL